MKKNVIMIIIGLLLYGCATPFAQFYNDRTGGADITKIPTIVISNEDPKLFRGSDPEKDSLQMLEEGYDLIGYSSFNAGNINVDGALIQAKKVHASIVFIYSQYTDTVSGSLPLTVPDTQTSTTSLHGSAYGYGGFTTFSGSGQTTTYGTRTMYFPYSVSRYDYLAMYWVKLKSTIFGVHTQELTPELRQKIGSNKGVYVYAVIKESPAFYADMLSGDILKKIGESEIYDMKNLQEALIRYAGQKVMVEFLREGKLLQKEIHLNQKLTSD